ncbi:MAG: cation-translocating P-type ATPase [Lachnospiraceae bacterium]|nr:cation-translocating P-type ATPase [Lachnospiraceae bacterium]
MDIVWRWMKGVNMQGLSCKEVEERIKEGKFNGNYTVKTKSIGEILISNTFTLFNGINLFLAIMLIMVGSYKNMMFMGVVFWNLFIGIFQEIRSKRIIDKLSLLQEPKAVVLREGKEITVGVEEIVLDDIVLYKGGRQIVADSLILEGNCQVNESLLTGESDLIRKKEGDTLLSGSFVVSGNAVSKVINVGEDNYVNKITKQAKYFKKHDSQMMKSIKQIIKFVTIILLPVGVLFFLNQMKIMNGNIKEAIEATVASVIGMIPSGMVLLTTMVLAVGVIKLARKDTLVKELYSIEELARVNVLCIDKTGTLTEGSMEVEDVISVCEKDVDSIKQLLQRYVTVMGDENATGKALLEYLGTSENCDNLDVTCRIDFSSEKKYSALEIKGTGTLVLGAYEFIINEQDMRVKKMIEEMSSRGLRVLTFAWSTRPIINDTIPSDMQVLGIVSLADKIRENAYETINFFKKQDVLVKVISGDNPATVSYIAMKAGIEGARNYVDATILDTDEKLRVAVRKYNVFGRVTPEQKLSIIKILKEENSVAMIGDGVNDVMALKEADCSVAMEAGADAARNVSMLVLMKSDFSSLPHVVAEGRQIVNNICRSATLYLNKTVYSTIFAFMFIFLPIAYPIEPIQLTLVGTLTIGIPSFILAMEKNHNRIEGNFLKKVLSNALPAGLTIVAGIIFTLALGRKTGTELIHIKAICAYVLAFVSFLNLINVCRPFSKFRLTIVSVLFAIFVGIIILAAEFFEFTLLNVKLWIFMAGFGMLLLIQYAVFKRLVGKY